MFDLSFKIEGATGKVYKFVETDSQNYGLKIHLTFPFPNI
jgi:hypothetical protein